MSRFVDSSGLKDIAAVERRAVEVLADGASTTAEKISFGHELAELDKVLISV